MKDERYHFMSGLDEPEMHGSGFDSGQRRSSDGDGQVRYKQMDRAKLSRILRYIDNHLPWVEAAEVSWIVIRESTDLQSHDDCKQLRRELLGR
jgi:hypothetical protein